MAIDEKHGRNSSSAENVKIPKESAETTGEQSGEVAGEGFILREGSATNAARQGPGPLPPVDFSGFVLGLGQMVLIHLGDLPEPTTGSTEVDLAQAAHTIDLLDMLAEKTRGNLTREEVELLGNLRKELKLKYVQSR